MSQINQIDPEIFIESSNSKFFLIFLTNATHNLNPILHNDILGDTVTPWIQKVKEFVTPNPYGGLAWLGITEVDGAATRVEYNKEKAAIDPTGSNRKAERIALKEKYRPLTPQPFREILDQNRPLEDERAKLGDPAVDNVNKGNAAFDEASAATGVIGKGLTIVAAVQSAQTVINSPNPAREALTEGVGWSGAVGGGALLGGVGSKLAGPYGGLFGGLLGGALGFTMGKKSAETTLNAIPIAKAALQEYRETSKAEGCSICQLAH